MKKKLVAALLTCTLIGGAGVLTVTKVKESPIEENVLIAQETEDLIEEVNNDTNNIEEVKTSDEIVTKTNNNIEDKPVAKEEQVKVKSVDKQQENNSQQSKSQSQAPLNTVKNPIKENIQNTSINNEKFMAQVEQAIYEKVNIERGKAGMSALSYNNTMQKYARIKSQDMGDKNYFDHKDLQGNLITVRMQNDGVKYSAWGENIAYIGGVSDPVQLANQFMNNWMNSSGHKANILSGNFASIGVGVYKVGNKVYATQEFYR